MTTEIVSLALRHHQTGIADWQYGTLARELHRWVPLFDVEFKLNLPSYPTIKFDKIRNAYATYAAGRGVYGEKDTITFNINELGRDPNGIHATLLHELIHLWQQYRGIPSSGNYHNQEFREKALECGLLVDEQGCHSGYTEIFSGILAKYGVLLDATVRPLSAVARVYGSSTHQQKLKKWICGCTIVRCATQLDAMCNRCGQRFLPS